MNSVVDNTLLVFAGVGAAVAVFGCTWEMVSATRRLLPARRRGAEAARLDRAGRTDLDRVVREALGEPQGGVSWLRS